MVEPKAGKNNLFRTFLTVVIVVVALIVLGVLAIQAWEATNSNTFCSYACHQVHPEEPVAFQDSYHASIKCVECHMGRLSTLQAIVLKVGHVRELPLTIFGTYQRPLESRTMRPATESCERCHYPPAFHGDRVREVQHYLPDENNSLQRTFLLLHTGGGERARGLGFGIHWHIENGVEFIATDERKQDIRWVRTTLPDGRTLEYNDVLNPLTPEEIQSLPKHRMDCVDCHNRSGHPFPSPDRAVDRALTEKQLDPELPWIKKEMVALLSAPNLTRENVGEAVASFEPNYRGRYPEAAAAHADDLKQAVQTATELASAIVFAQEGVNWKSFPDNVGHSDFPGCFRCHDGKHLAASGESIRLHCNICHSIPVVVGKGDRVPPMPVTTVQEPPSHLETNFIKDHRFLANGTCASCHGQVVFGTDNSSFCANSACHGRSWPQVELNAAFPHPIPLVGAHANVWCHECHQGVEKPQYVCANCHQPPANHFTAGCDQCHTPDGWQQSAAKIVSASARIPHPLEGRENCLACHDPAGQVRPAPKDHVGRTNAQCLLCHQPAGQAAAPPVGTTPTVTATAPVTAGVPTSGALTATATVAPGTAVTVTPTRPVGAVASSIPHPLEGRENCLACHDPAGQVRPAPKDHVGRTNAQCTACHQPAVSSAAPTPTLAVTATPGE